MKGNILTIIKKELFRFFVDKRIVFSTILLPGIMIYVLYTFMGEAISSQINVEDDYKATCYVENVTDELQDFLEKQNFKVHTVSSDDEVKKVKDKIKEKNADLCVVFPENFYQDIQTNDIKSGKPAPNVSIFYNSSNKTSSTAYSKLSESLSALEGSMTNRFDVNAGKEEYDCATEEDSIGMMFSSMLPMLLMMFMFSGVLGVTPDSIAGEKERGTIATLLVTPMKRSHLAIGKVVALSVIALLSGLSSTLGTILSLPKMLMMGESSEADKLAQNVYSVQDYLVLTVIVLSTILVFVVILSCISAFAKTIKEAQTYATPVMLICMFLGITAMFGSGASTDWYSYLIPVYNSVQSMISIFSFEIVPQHIIFTCASNIVVTGLGILLLTKMFNSEKVVFSK